MVVLGIVLGVVVGPSAPGWFEPDLTVQTVALPGLAQIGTPTGRMSPQAATGLVCAGLVSVLVFPAPAVAITGRERSREDAEMTRAATQTPEPRPDR